MANKPIASNLPADLPTNWQTNQIVSPNGTEVGLDAQHGFNYLAKQVNDAQTGVNAINDAFPGLATTKTLTVTVPVSWTASGSFYYQQVSIAGMLATDNPVADILPGSDNAANKLYAEAWSKVQSGEPMNGAVKLWATSAPTTAFTLQLKITRTGNETGQGKCILAGHPPVGGQIGYGTYTGDGAATRTILLGITPKWVLVTNKYGQVGTWYMSENICGGLAVENSPLDGDTLKVVSGGFQVKFLYVQSSGGTPYATNSQSSVYNYIYGT